MKRLLALCFYSFALLAQSATYWVDFDGGNNASAGTSTGAAWKHCPGDANATGTAASTTPAAGDTIYFKGGVRYRGSVTVNWSGSSGSPIVLDGSPSGWGTGRAIMDGTVDFTNTWTQCTSTNDVGGNTNFASIWYANANGGQTYFWQTVIVSNQFLPFAQDFVPTEPIWFDDVHNGWTNITTSGNVTTNFIKDSAYLTQPAGYWDGCWVGVFVDGNGTRFAAITNYFPATNTIRFALPPQVSFYGTTKYSIMNNMRSITYEGQYALITNRMYYWPLGGGNPNNQTVRVASLGDAFILSNEQHVRIQGFQIEGYYSHVEAGYGASAVTLTSGTRNDGIRFTDNLVQFMRSMDRGPVLNLQGTTNLVVANNTLRQSLRNRGMIIQGHDVTVSSNLLDRIGSTGIYCAGVGSFGSVNTFINSNRVTGLKGVHGNGISLYQGSTNAVCAYNYIDECYSPLTYEESGNITFHHNLIDVTLGSLDEWGGMAGYVHWINNTIVGTYSGGGFNVRWWDSGGPDYRMQNNIIEQQPPAATDIPANTVYSHNLFLTTNTVTLPPACLIRTNKTLNFTAYKSNMRPLVTFQGRDLGTNVSGFGVTLDMDGATLDSSPDMGAWQYLDAIVTNNASGARVIGFRGLGVSVLPPPVSPYLLEQDFEGTGYDNSQTWAEVGSGTLNEDYTSTVLVGSQSMLIDLTSNIGDTASPIITMPSGGGDIWYVYFQLRVLTFPSSGFRVATVTNSFDLSINASSNLVIRPQVGTGVATVGKLEAGVTYHVWMQGSGNDVETSSAGTARVGFSTTGIRPTSGDNYAIDTDVSANGPFTGIQLILGTRQIGANYSVIIDKVRVDNDLIGDNPQ